MSRSSAPVAVAMETVAFALIGAAVEVPRCLPRVIGQQKTKIDQQLTLARFLGKMAVTQVQSELKRRLAAGQAHTAAAPSDSTMTTKVATFTPETPVSSVTLVASEMVAASLPLEQYDELSASQVISRLAHLDAAELDAVYDYESSNRRRRTVLGRLDQLRSASV